MGSWASLSFFFYISFPHGTHSGSQQPSQNLSSTLPARAAQSLGDHSPLRAARV